MKKLVICVMLILGGNSLFAEPKELTGTLAPTKVEMDGKKVASYVLKTSDGEFKVDPKLAKKLKKFEGKMVKVKAEVNEENTIEKITSLKPEKPEKKK